MKIISIPIIALVLFSMIGCSMPAAAIQRTLCSFTREEKVTKGFMGERKSVTIKDFRGNEAYDEDMEGFKKEAEEYISKHPDLKEAAKDNLRNLRITQGSGADEVTLLLGKPDKVVRAAGKSPYGASEIWIYKLSKMRAFTIFIIPVFFVHEGYYLYFKDRALVEIERHYLEQVVHQGQGAGTGIDKSRSR